MIEGHLDTEVRDVVALILAMGWEASVYLGPAAEAACRNGTLAAGCPESPCPICPPRSCNTMHCRYIRKVPGEFTVHTVVFPQTSGR